MSRRKDQGLICQIGVRCTPTQLQFCEAIGSGNASVGIRLLIDKAMAKQLLPTMSPLQAARLTVSLLEQQEAQ